MNYQETVEYLYNRTPLFQNVGGKAYKEGLENTLLLDERFGHPHRQYKTIHVAGTNGKGSCAHTIAAILQSAGYRTGLYTSPHLVDFRERIRVNGEMISEEYVVDFVENERTFFEPLHPSFFEVTTALAFKFFADAKVDVAVIEVGLGGRLDCTNIITPVLSIITNISLDHTQFLGTTLTEIAKEKAGIIKPNIPVIIGEITPETQQVFIDKAYECNAYMRFADEDNEILNYKSDESNSNIIYETRPFGIIKGELTGSYQIKNTTTIISALKILQRYFYISREHIRTGFAQVCSLTGLMGRWQVISTNPLVVCDTGHNSGGWQYLGQQLRAYKDGAVHVILGMASDKDAKSVLVELPKSAFCHFAPPSVARAMPTERLMTIANSLGLQSQSYNSVAKAFLSAIKSVKTQDLVFIGGSNFVVADFLSFIKAHNGDYV